MENPDPRRPATNTTSPTGAAAACPHCGSERRTKQGRTRDGRPRHRCKDCGRITAEPPTAAPRPPCPVCGRTRCKPASCAPRPGAPAHPCSRCGATRWYVNGTKKDGTHKYLCRGCRRAPNPRSDVPCPPCPHCGGRCERHGKRGRLQNQIYQCLSCRRTNTEGMRWPRPDGGPCPYRVTLCLGVLAAIALEKYVQTTRLHPNDAVRHILRRAAHSPAALVAVSQAVYDRDGNRRIIDITPRVPARPDPFLREVDRPLPDLRSQVQRKRMSDPDTRHRCTVYVDWLLSVSLDAKAKEGLLRTARSLSITHQEAARLLIENARPPGQERSLVATAPRR